MSAPPPRVEPLLELAAELRAAGASWETIGQQLHRHRETCRRWPKLYPEIWSRLLAACRAEQRQNAAGEAMTVLRTLLRSEDEKIRRDVGRVLFAAAEPPTPHEPTTDDEWSDDYLQKSSEGDRRQLAESIANVNARPPDGGGEAGAD